MAFLLLLGNRYTGDSSFMIYSTCKDRCTDLNSLSAACVV